jgi:hypothetical protein
MAGEPAEQDGPSGMTDLQEALMGADGDVVRRDGLARLDASLARLDARLMTGLDPRDMSRSRQVRQALEAARLVLAGK